MPSEIVQPVEIQPGDVIQIAPLPTIKEPFHYKLAFVDEVKMWGVVAYVATFEGVAYIRLEWDGFVRIGPAAYVGVSSPETDS